MTPGLALGLREDVWPTPYIELNSHLTSKVAQKQIIANINFLEQQLL
jgi:hypothetical protein